jgi:Fe-S oxidoreductase
METLKLCVSCKGCKRECPTGVDMAKMKIEVMAARAARGKLTLRDYLVAYLPHYAPMAARTPWLLNLRNRLPGAAWLSEKVVGFTARRPLPAWRSDVFRSQEVPDGAAGGAEVMLFADTFNTYFEPENMRAAALVLAAAGYRVRVAAPANGARPLCCGRTFLSAGLVEDAKTEAQRLVTALAPFVEHGVPVIGLEPSCLFTLRDELQSMLPGEGSAKVAAHAFLFEEFLAREASEGRLDLMLGPIGRRAYLHGHCHQKAFGALGATEAVLRLVPDLEVETITSSCCGMAGAFGYQAETFDVSMAIGELSLLPSVRKAEPDALIVADGTSCRQQIEDGAGRNAIHVARVLERALAACQTELSPA